MKEKIIVGIDAINLRQGGGRTHLIELLHAFKKSETKVSKVIVWGSRETLELISDSDKIDKRIVIEGRASFLKRFFFQAFKFKRIVQNAGCDVFFAPGGSFLNIPLPVVTMCRNMLLFEFGELKRYGVTLFTMKLILLRFVQIRSYKQAGGVIFLSRYALDSVKELGVEISNAKVIPHGLNNRFMRDPSKNVEGLNRFDEPINFLYVSSLEPYKHQTVVLEAINDAREITGRDLRIDFVGPASYPQSHHNLLNMIRKYDSTGSWANYHGAVKFEVLHEVYGNTDVGIFASSCENMPNTLIEMMGASLPIICSNRGAMPEFLKEAGLYFDPESPSELTDKIQELLHSSTMHKKLAHSAHSNSLCYSWNSCCNSTFDYLYEIYLRNAK